MLAIFVQGEAEFLDGADDNFLGHVVGQQAADMSAHVGVFSDAVYPKTVKFLAGLAVEVFAVDDEKAPFNVGVGLEQRGGLEVGARILPLPVVCRM